MADTIKGLNITIGADTKQFNKEIKAVDRELRSTTKTVDALQKSLELEFDSKKFAEAQRLAQEAITKTDDKAKALKEQMEYLEKSGGDVNSRAYRDLQTELIKTEDNALKLRKQLEQINNIQFTALGNKIKSVGEGFTKAGQAITPFSIAAAGALAGIGAIGLGAVESADELQTFADRVNMSAEELQKWQYIAMQTDLSANELQMAFTKLQQGLGKQAIGEVDMMTEALDALGISTEDAAKGMGYNFNTIIQNLSRMEDSMAQAGYANELFGAKMASKLLPMIKSGGEGLAELTAEFEALGYMSNEQVKSLAEFDNVMNKLKYQFSLIKNELGAALVPLMESFASLIETRVIPPLRALSEWFSNLSLGQQQFAVGALAVVASLAPVLLFMGAVTKGVGGIVSSLGGLSKALTFLMAHPIIAIIGIIAALLVMLYTTNEDFRESINSLVGTLGKAFAPILELIGGLLKTVFDALMPLITLLGTVLTPIIDALNPILGVMGTILGAVLGPKIKMLTLFAEKLGQVFTWIAGIITKYVVPVFGIFEKAISGVLNAIPKMINKVIDMVEEGLNSLIRFINNVIDGINGLGKHIGFTLGKLNEVEIGVRVGSLANEKTQVQTPPPSASEQVQNTIQQTDGYTAVTNNITTTNDYSNKDIVINVTVENYAEEVDVDDMVRQINLKLASQM